MRVEFLGGVRTVTGSATLPGERPVKMVGRLRDVPGKEGRSRKEIDGFSPIVSKDLDFISCLTHAHIDHMSVLIPRTGERRVPGKGDLHKGHARSLRG